MVKFNDVKKGCSLFRFLPSVWLTEEPNNRAIHRLFTLMRKTGALSVITEAVAEDHELVKEECEAVDAYYGQNVEKKIHRVVFLVKDVSDVDELKEVDMDEDFLSCSIIINYKTPEDTWKSYLFQSISSIPRKKTDAGRLLPLLNNYVHFCKKFSCDIKVSETETIEFHIYGTYFCQQNGITNVCSHASLCMTINNNDLPGTDQVSCEDVNKALKIDHSKKMFENGGGLQLPQIVNYLESLGLELDVFSFFDNPNVDYAEHAYRYMEGGLPTLLVFSTKPGQSLHIVPIVGHTLNSDMWRPEAEYIYSGFFEALNYRPSSTWVDHFIIHDDNYGMYSCLPVDSLRRTTLPKYDTSFRAFYTIAIKPKEVKASPLVAEISAVQVLTNILQNTPLQNGSNSLWINELLLSSKRHSMAPLTARTSLVSKGEYHKNLAFKDFEGNEFSATDKALMMSLLPNTFWLCEITLPDLYTANKTKLVDVIINCENPINHLQEGIAARVFVRLPGFIIGGNNVLATNVNSHYPLFRRETGHDCDEW